MKIVNQILKIKKKFINNGNNSKERKQVIKINNNCIQNSKTKPLNIFSNKTHYIPVSNNKSNNIGNQNKEGSKGKLIKKTNEINISNKKIISHTSNTTNKPINNSGVIRKNVKIGGVNNNIPTGKIQINKMGKTTTSSTLNKPKPTSAKIKK